MSSKIKPIILCGGSGTRLWPLSRESFPKQFVPLIGGKSLLELTIARVKNFGFPMCVANEEHRFFVQDALRNESIGSDFETPSIFLEPSGLNTAAAIASAALMPGVLSSDLLLILPSDHFITDIDEFVKTIQAGVPVAQAGFIVTFGIQASYPSPAYGYIKRGDKLKGLSSHETSAYVVDHFIEKPSVDKAQQMLLSENYYWNAGIFLSKASTLISALSQHAPDILSSCQSAMAVANVDGNFIRPEKETFLTCRSESIDYAVMEHFNKVAVIPFKGSWSDVGGWNAVAKLSSPDQLGNRIHGQGFAIDSTDTYIYALDRPVVALGTSQLSIIDTPDAILVASVEKLEQVKDVVATLKKAGRIQAISHRKVLRPWGWFDSVDRGEKFQVKRIVVKPGASLSLQIHRHRAEHWIVVKGTAKVTNGDKTFLLEENESTYIPIGTKHRLENPKKTDLEMIEIQSGDYLGEDDIERFEDSYGRS